MSESTESIQVWCAGEDWCPVTSTATLICRKWHPVIVHRLLNAGPMGFTELKEEVDGVSSKVLSDSLEDLQNKNLVDRSIISENRSGSNTHSPHRVQSWSQSFERWKNGGRAISGHRRIRAPDASEFIKKVDQALYLLPRTVRTPHLVTFG